MANFRLKEREDKKRDEKIALYEYDKMELQKIAEEIEQYKKKADAQVKIM